MSGRIPLSLAAILLLAAPAGAGAAVFQVAGPSVGSSQGSDPGVLGQQDPQGGQDGISDAQSFALVAGQILGAASACEKIDENRVSDATQKAVKITKDSAESQEDIEAAQQYMLDAADSARDAVKNGTADCDRVSASFSKLEQVEQGSNQQSRLGDPDDQNGSSGDQDQDDAE